MSDWKYCGARSCPWAFAIGPGSAKAEQMTADCNNARRDNQRSLKERPPRKPEFSACQDQFEFLGGKYNDILLIDDDATHAKAFEDALIARGDGPSNIEWVRTLSSGLERLAHKGVWAIFLNLFLPDSWGLRTLDRLLL